MASVKICDGRTVVYQYDTGVLIELCDCRDFTECHFVVKDGIIRREVDGNICSVPDAALMNAGALTVYAFSRNDDGGQTHHTFFIHVMPRPKPADYIDPPDEADYFDQIVNRATGAIKHGVDGGYYTPTVDAESGELSWNASKEGMPGVPAVNIKGEPGYTPVKGKDYTDGASVTVQNVSESTEDGGINEVAFSDGKRLRVKNGERGEMGQRGSKVLKINVFYFSAHAAGSINGITTKIKISLDILKSESGETEVYVGDAVLYKTDLRYVVYVDDAYAYLADPISIKGDPGYTPVKGKDYKDGASVTHRWEGTTLHVTSASGTSSADLKGDKGDNDLLVVRANMVGGVLYADKTPSEIDAANNAGKGCVLQYNGTHTYRGRRIGTDGQYHPCFATAIELNSNGNYYQDEYFVMDDNAIVRSNKRVAVANPNYLNIDGAVSASYDGSETKNVNLYFVRYDGQQTLTDAEKLIARQNLGITDSGGDSGIVTVNFATEDMENFTADKTYAEMQAAFTEGKMLYANLMGAIVVPLVSFDGENLLFSGLMNDSGANGVIALTVVPDNTATMILTTLNEGGEGGSGGAILVNLSTEDGETFTADKTLAELFEAATHGQSVFMAYEGMVAPVQTVNESYAVFTVIVPDFGDGGGKVTFILTSDNNVTMQMLPDSGGGGLTIVTVEGETPSMTSAEISAAISTGKQVMCMAMYSNMFPVMLNPVVISEKLIVFYAYIDLEPLGMMGLKSHVSAYITGDTAQVSESEVVGGKPLTIGDVQYDGTESVTIEMEEWVFTFADGTSVTKKVAIV